MVDTDQGNLFITNGTFQDATGKENPPFTQISGGTTVQINLTQKIDYILLNAVTFLPIFISKGNRGDIPFARARDLKLITETISVQGFLAEDENERAIDKRNLLIALMQTGSALKIIWGLGNYQTFWQPDDNAEVNTGAFITKLQFTETVGILGELKLSDTVNDQAFVTRNIAVQLQVGRGKDL